LGEDAKKKAFHLANDLRAKGVSIEMDHEAKSLKSQLKRADKLGAKYTIIIGEDEVNRKKVRLRDMLESTEIEIDENDVKEHLK
jgi:histidyl-tRNA synthetase